MSVILAGGTGFIGRTVAKVLNRNGYEVICITRDTGHGIVPHQSPHYDSVITWSRLVASGLPADCKAVINLCGENIMKLNRRWTPLYKEAVMSSRVDSTKKLRDLILDARVKPKAFITASGVGFYPPSATAAYDEYSAGGRHDFLAHVTVKWEEASRLPASAGCRTVNLRTGAVLGRHGGVIKNLYWPFFFGLGGPVGRGNQPFPWIHIEDIAHLYLYAMENDKCTGVYNAVSPHIITNADFTRAFASALHRPACLPTPPFVLNALLGEERAKILTHGQIVHPKRLLDAGYKFIYPDINEACCDVVAPPDADDL
ncbi:Epimerase family protein SDR39U1 [Hypsibius exemplaris]|uniref:Epimerase family protein SDR39U1 n=1 Tax=Hypsibius exemplaris TaxID=2072580 RepID=A0A9X6NHX0_HYPEX|nr:Epimerase family protein SDR39U1 [Hypsibius exemplaris]